MHGVGAADRREEFDGCQEDPESDEGANCAAESGGRGQAVRVGWSGHFPGRAIEGRGARPVGRAVRTGGRPLRVGPAGRSGGGLHAAGQKIPFGGVSRVTEMLATSTVTPDPVSTVGVYGCIR